MATVKTIPWQPDEDTDELIRLYVESTKRAYHVCAAFVMAGQEPPPEHVQGLKGSEVDIVAAHYRRYDPHGSVALENKLKNEGVE
jgi:hypothetical protein